MLWTISWNKISTKDGSFGKVIHNTVDFSQGYFLAYTLQVAEEVNYIPEQRGPVSELLATF